jgi:osmotically-inducible protein OsmY
MLVTFSFKKGNPMNRSRNTSNGTYPQKSNNRSSAYNSNYQPRYGSERSSTFGRESGETGDQVNYGSQRNSQNEQESLNSYRNQGNANQNNGSQDQQRNLGNREHHDWQDQPQQQNDFTRNPDRNWNSGSSNQQNQYGRADKFGSAYQTGGAENYADRGYSQQAGGWGEGRGQSIQYSGQERNRYPSTKRFSNDDRESTWSGAPSSDSDYGMNHVDLDTRSESHAGKGPKNYRRSDERIHEDVSEALTHAHHIDASEIEVDVKEGIVTLSGAVTDRKVKRWDEDAIENLPGVKDVKNNITVSSSNSSLGSDNEKTTKKSSSSSKLQ